MRISILAAASVACCVSSLLAAEPQSAAKLDELKPLAGHWFVSKSEPARYFYQDADVLVEPFTRVDTNKDGIDDIRVSHDEAAIIVRSQCVPNHPTAKFPNSQNPNTIKVQDFTFRVPLVPKKAETITRLPMGPVGVAINGVVFFNPFEIGGMNAVEGYAEVWLDSCCGHPQQTGVYHYHKYPTCVKSPFPDEGKRHSPLLGFAFDGFPVYGPYESEGKLAKDLTGESALDVCNGHADKVRGYHYHVTPGRFPYIFGGYAGVPEPSNNRRLGRAQEGALKDNAEGESKLDRVLASAKPGALPRGVKTTLTFELDADATTRAPLPRGAPVQVHVGPYAGASIERKGSQVTAEFTVPADASAGALLDAHVEFTVPGGRTVVYKKNDVVRVVTKDE